MAPDLSSQLDLSLRILVAAVAGAVIGLEREIHHHPAGMRTHLLVALGAGAFTVLSIDGFTLPPAPNGSIPVDPSRVAAQIVTGIGFLGAGAIIKYGTTIKGLTTAGSLWATAAIGMAAGAGAWLLTAAATAIVIASLWPLHVVVERLRLRSSRAIRVRLRMQDLPALDHVVAEAANRRIEVRGVRVQRTADGYEAALELRIPAGAVPSDILRAFAEAEGVELIDAERDADDE